MTDVSVVICAYTEKRWDDLLAAIESVRNQSVPAREIIVVVDNNPDFLQKIRAYLPQVITIANDGTPGLGGARNSGVAASTGTVIAFLDDDAIASSDWLKHLIETYKDPRVVGVGGSIEPAWQGGRPAWFPEEFDWVVGCTYRGMPERATTVRNLIGCNMSYRREVFAATGNFRLGYGCDETEFCIRLSRHWPDHLLIYQPLARVYHQVPSSRGTWRHFISRCYFEGGSKAVVAWLQGSRDGLASERAYTMKTLPQGFLKGMLDTVKGGDLSGIARSGAILVGLFVTTAGYLTGTLRVNQAASRRGWTGPLQTESPHKMIGD